MEDEWTKKGNKEDLTGETDSEHKFGWREREGGGEKLGVYSIGRAYEVL